MKNKRVVIGAFLLIIIFFLGIFIFSNSYSADSGVNKYLKDSKEVKIKKIKNGYFFDGPGRDKALIFYPGAMVDSRSYAKLMNNLAENGIDCFLLKMPFKIAFFGKNRANYILNKYKYEHFIIGGHSLGGVVATEYLSNNSKSFEYLVLLASYPTKKIDNAIGVLSIYGDNDGVLNMNNFDENKKYFSKNSKVVQIVGGNHANFGNYGSQKKDNDADISSDVQQSQTVSAIIDFCK